MSDLITEDVFTQAIHELNGFKTKSIDYNDIRKYVLSFQYASIYISQAIQYITGLNFSPDCGVLCFESSKQQYPYIKMAATRYTTIISAEDIKGHTSLQLPTLEISWSHPALAFMMNAKNNNRAYLPLRIDSHRSDYHNIAIESIDLFLCKAHQFQSDRGNLKSF